MNHKPRLIFPLCLLFVCPFILMAEEMNHEDSLPPGVIAIPQVVQQNLGITFAKVERRIVQETRRYPGRFELQASGRSEYHLPSDGRVIPLVQLNDEVDAGSPLYRMESSRWSTLQRELNEAKRAAELLRPRLESLQKAVDAAQLNRINRQERLGRLQNLQLDGAAQSAQVSEAQSDLAEAERELAESVARHQEAQLEALALQNAEGENVRFAIALQEAATLFGCATTWLLEEVEGKERWETLNEVVIRARHSGTVTEIFVSDGEQRSEGDLVMRILDPRKVHFRAFAPQSDSVYLSHQGNGLIVPSYGAIETYESALPVSYVLGIEAHSIQRSIDLFALPESNSNLPVWVRPGVTAFLEVVTEGSTEPEFAIPVGSVLSDGLERIFFMRDRQNPEQVRRMVADLGASDGRWIVVNSGVRPSDEVVLTGVYELKLSTSGVKQEGGHFHSDGTFHEEGH